MEQWLQFGMEQGWCTETVCFTCDGFPMTEEESDLFERGYDPCVHGVRLL
jgi:hypothetical protein